MIQYLIASFSNRQQAESAYSQLKSASFDLEEIWLASPGDTTLDKADIFDPTQALWQRTWRMMLWIIPFGFIAGFAFHLSTQLPIWEGGSPLANHCLGGLFGAIAGTLGGFNFGGGTQLLFDKSKRLLKQRLMSGEHLLIARGSDLFIRQVNRELQYISKEKIDLYEAPQ
jgi:hypothetical protein